jgi:hypothetical protein
VVYLLLALQYSAAYQTNLVLHAYSVGLFEEIKEIHIHKCELHMQVLLLLECGVPVPQIVMLQEVTEQAGVECDIK